MERDRSGENWGGERRRREERRGEERMREFYIYISIRRMNGPCP
jgi:hypothetical protein